MLSADSNTNADVVVDKDLNYLMFQVHRVIARIVCTGDKNVVDIMYDTCGEDYVFDGKKRYRWFPPTKLQQPKKSSDEDSNASNYISGKIWPRDKELYGEAGSI